MRVIGVTGTIGAGKSTVLAWLAERGARTVDADALVHRLYWTSAPLRERLAGRFGPQVLSAAGGAVDRAALRRAVSAPGALADLEAIVHPEVRRARDALLAEARAGGAPVFAYEAIRLVESGSADVCDELWIVVAPEAVQLARLAGRGMDAEEARRRLAWQGTVAGWVEAFGAASARLGDPRPVVVFDNGGAPEQGRATVDRLWSGVAAGA